MDKIEQIKQQVEEFVKHLGVTGAEISFTENEANFKVSIKLPDERVLTGRDNDRLEPVCHIIRRMVAKILGEEKRVVVDINDQQAKNDEVLKTKAKIIADRAREFKMEIEMDPMSSYERMVVHTALENSPNIKTESRGEGHNRRIVVCYIDGENQKAFAI